MSRSLNGNDISVHAVEQTVKGTVPAAPAFDEVRRTGGMSIKTREFVQSEEVKTNNQGRVNIADKSTLSAEIAAPTTKQTIGFLLKAMKSPETPFTVTAANIQFTATNMTAAAGTPFASLNNGDFVFIGGSGSNDRAYKITNKISGDDVVLSPSPTIEAAGASITVASNRTITGKTNTYYTLQTRVYDESLGGDNTSYQTQYDHLINTLSLEIGETGIVNNSIAFLGENEIAGEAIIAGQTDNARDSSETISASNDITTFWDDSSPIACTIKSMSIELNNNLIDDDAAGCNTQYGDGQMAISASVSARNPVSDALVWKGRSDTGTRASYAVQLDHGSGDFTIIQITRGVITEHSMPSEGDTVANSEMTIAAEEDANNETFTVTRNWS